MNRPIFLSRSSRAVLAAVLAVMLSGCLYDYGQHSDRISYSAGDAVKANLESQTTNPSSNTQHDVNGLGKTGSVIEQEPIQKQSIEQEL